jgi:hypothetical protein
MTEGRHYFIAKINSGNNDSSSLVLYVLPEDKLETLESFCRETEIFRFTGNSEVFRVLGINGEQRKRRAKVSITHNDDYDYYQCQIEAYDDNSSDIIGMANFRASISYRAHI